MKRSALLLFIWSLVSCGSSKVASDRFVVENLAGLTSEELKENYPDANIREDKGVFEEGTVERPFSLLYPDTPDELQITWEDEARTKIHDLYFAGNGRWKSEEGIRVGTPYDRLNEINGKEVSFYGFGWDYSGAVVWNQGKMEDTRLRVFVGPEAETGNKFMGDHIIEASPDEIAALGLKVEAVIFQN